MEVSDVRRQVLQAIEQAKRTAANRRTRHDETTRDYETFLQQVAVPLFRQVAGVLKPEGHTFQVFTPGGSVRLMAESRSEDYIEVSLDTSGDVPYVVGLTSVARGHRVLKKERPVADGQPIPGEDELLSFLVTELAPFVEK